MARESADVRIIAGSSRRFESDRLFGTRLEQAAVGDHVRSVGEPSFVRAGGDARLGDRVFFSGLDQRPVMLQGRARGVVLDGEFPLLRRL